MERTIILLILAVFVLFLLLDNFFGNKQYLTKFVAKTITV